MTETETTEPAPVDQPGSPAGTPRAWMRWALPVGALVIGLAIGFGVAAGTADPTQSDEYLRLEQNHEDAKGRIVALSDQSREAREEARVAREEAAQRQADLDGQEAALSAREAAVAAVEQQIAANSIRTGIWTVGVDVEPGTYRVSQALTGYCYWAIYRTGTNGDDIIENDGPTGGFPTVTLSVGQDFENSGCGTFVKQ